MNMFHAGGFSPSLFDEEGEVPVWPRAHGLLIPVSDIERSTINLEV
jgi:hypothetical protein